MTCSEISIQTRKPVISHGNSLMENAIDEGRLHAAICFSKALDGAVKISQQGAELSRLALQGT
eukprot:scaffold609177_cov23-Prasinocladus_malaysianus.AAC.1